MPNVPRRISNKNQDIEVDAADVTYTPIDETDWDNDQDPGNVDDALDELADRTNTNEDLLNELLPAAAPSLSDMSTSVVGVSARLSYGPTSALSNPVGYTLHPTLDTGDLFNNTSPNRGVISGSTTISGTLADAVTAESAGAYPADAFGPGDEGTLNLVVNGSTIQSADLSSFAGGVSINGNGSGFNLSASIPVQFPSGADFSGRQYRTGSWFVQAADLRDGYNTVQVTHVTGAGTATTEEYYYIVDSDVTATIISDTAWGSLVTSGSKHLSGVEYHTDASATFSADIANAYRTTYSNGNAITYPNPNNCSLSSQSYPDPGASGFTNFLDDISQTATLNATRIITGLTTYDGFRARIRGTRPLLSTATSGYLEGFQLLIDRQSANSNDLENTFNDENYRIPSNADFATDLSSTWDETISLVSATAGYSDGLQTINSGLRYPSLDFSNTTIADGPSGNPDYSSASGDRFYYGYFTDSTGAANFRLTLLGSGVQVIAESASFTTAAQIKISIRLPSETGWLDITQPFVEPNFNDGDGCYAATFGNDQTINSTNWGLTVGTRNTANSFDKVYYRITAPATFTGNLTEISIEWAVV